MATKLIPKTPSAYSYPLLIKNILNTPITYSPRQEIIYRNQIRHTYESFYQRVHRLARALENAGVKQGDTVAILDWDSHRYLECFFAIPMMGAVLHTVNIRLSPEQLVYTMNHAEDDVVLVFEDFLPMIAAVKDQLTTVKNFILLKDSDAMPETGLAIDGEYETLLSENDGTYDFPDFDENSMATTFYTTGTTGLPKGVYFSHRQLVLHTFGLISALCAFKSHVYLDAHDVYMPLTPMFHVHGWGIPFATTLLGVKQVYPGRYEPDMLIKLITEHGVTFSHCVPTIIHMIINHPSIKQHDLSKWKVIIGGSALPGGLCKAAAELGITMTSAYGMSETCPLLTAANAKPHMMDWDMDKQIELRCKTGLPVPMVQLKITDPVGNALPADGKSTGEVVVRAPWLTQGYLKEPEKSEELWKDGWLHTGDIGYVDDEGYLQITDRLKDVIKTGGEWISSLELENLVSRHEAVSETAVIGVPDEKWGERPLAFVVLKEGFAEKVSEGDLKTFLMEFVDNGTIPKYGVPNRIVITDTIPKTSVGKISKKQLRENFH
jgi:fatty-acyl-CoA synthase